MLRWKRTLRTFTSEHFEAYRSGDPASEVVGTADLHFVESGRVIATVVLYSKAGWSDEQIPDLLASLDEELLPSADAAEGTLRYTVIIGDVLAEAGQGE